MYGKNGNMPAHRRVGGHSIGTAFLKHCLGTFEKNFFKGMKKISTASQKSNKRHVSIPLPLLNLVFEKGKFFFLIMQ